MIAASYGPFAFRLETFTRAVLESSLYVHPSLLAMIIYWLLLSHIALEQHRNTLHQQ